MPANLIALDLGAESGRAVLAQLDGGKLTLEPVHRFPNGPVRVHGSMFWDVLSLYTEIKRGMAMCAERVGGDVVSIGVDTWGVDFALLDQQGSLLANPYHYRDRRTEGMIEEACARVPRREIFGYTGIQFMPLNTLFQLFSMGYANSPLLDIADRLLTMPDLLNYWLTGEKVCEFSNATTTQFYNPREKAWAKELLERLGLPTHFLGPIVPSGTKLGPLTTRVADETRLERAVVVAPACHDTGSAVAGVPAKGRDYAYMSSGTWSLLGIEIAEPIINDAALEYNFTNEGGVGGTIRFLKNIMGLWLVQECRRTWERQGDVLGYDEITRIASDSPAFAAFVEPDAADFLAPTEMPAAIQAFCRNTGQAVPESKGAIIRCALESLGMKYRWVLQRLEEICGHTLDTIHVVGGGSQNKLLCQFAADATGRPIAAGPVEATAIGNVLVQAVTMGLVGSLAEAREIVAQSFEVVTYEPVNTAVWDEQYGRYLKVMESANRVL